MSPNSSPLDLNRQPWVNCTIYIFTPLKKASSFYTMRCNNHHNNKHSSFWIKESVLRYWAKTRFVVRLLFLDPLIYARSLNLICISSLIRTRWDTHALFIFISFFFHTHIHTHTTHTHHTHTHMHTFFISYWHDIVLLKIVTQADKYTLVINFFLRSQKDLGINQPIMSLITSNQSLSRLMRSLCDQKQSSIWGIICTIENITWTRTNTFWSEKLV